MRLSTFSIPLRRDRNSIFMILLNILHKRDLDFSGDYSFS
jgi:hypothetical protein